MHGNPAWVAEFGSGIGIPVREALVDVPTRLFAVIDRVHASGRALACWLEIRGERRRLTATPRRDPETDEVYGVAIRIGRG